MKKSILWLKQHPLFWQCQLGMLLLAGFLYVLYGFIWGTDESGAIRGMLPLLTYVSIFSIILGIGWYRRAQAIDLRLQVAITLAGFAWLSCIFGYMVSNMPVFQVVESAVGMAVALLANGIFSLFLTNKAEKGILQREISRKESEALAKEEPRE